MAQGYIGKISAVVTANTSDLSRKLQGSVKDVDRFAKSVQSSINASSLNAQKSLERIFTPLQNLERKLKASLGQTLSLNLPVDKIRAFVSAAEQINKPIESIQKGFSSLSTGLQAQVLPALNRLQDQALLVNQTIEETGSVGEKRFASVTRSVEEATKAFQRLQQAQSLSAQSLTGNELQFSNPLLFQTLNASAATTRSAAALPPSALESGSIAKSVQSLRQYQEAAVEAQATLENLRLDPKIDPRIVRSQEQRLQSLTETARRAQEQLQRVIDVQGNIGASTPFMSTRDPQGRSITERLQSGVLREQLQDEDRLVAAQQALGKKIANGFLTIITEAEAAADTLQARQQELGRRIANGFLTVITEEEAAVDTLQARQQELGRRIANGFLAVITEEEAAVDTLQARQQGLGRRIADGFLTVITEQEAAADTLQARQQGLGRRIADGFLNILTPSEAAADTFAGKRAITASEFRKGFGGPGVDGLALGLDKAAIGRYAAQLQVLQAAIGKVSAEARGPAYTAFLKLRDAIANAMDRGELETEQTRQELKALTTDAVNATAAVAGIGAKTLGRSVSRAGDIGRAGFDKFSLALNQAAFAVDDFTSSTGGLEFKLRAVQNNVTQLAFILGNTKGLFIGLGAVIGAQLAIGLLKATGLLSEQRDVLDALNDAFNEQQQRVAALADSYDRLGDSIRDAGLDDAGRTQASRRRELDEIRRLEEEARVARAAAVDPEVNRLRVERAGLQRRAEESGVGAVRASLEIELRKLDQEIERRSREAGQRQSTQDTVANTLSNVAIDRINTEIDLAIRNAQGEGAVIGLEQERQRRLEEQRQLNQQFNQPGFDDQAQLAAVENAIAETNRAIASLGGFNGILTDPFGVATDEYIDQLERLTAEQAALEARIRDSAPGEALIRFTEAAYGVADVLDRARADIESADIGRTLTSDALTAVNEAINTRLQQARQARDEGDTARLDRLTLEIEGLQEFASELESVTSATRIFSDVLRRVSDDLNETVLGEARGRAEQARRRENEANAAMGLNNIGGNFANADGFIANEVERRARAEARRAEEQAAQVRNENNRLRREFEADAQAGNLGAGTQALIEERRRIQQELDSGDLSVEEERRARERQQQIDRELDRQFEDSAAGRQARANADAADSAAAEARLRADSAARGERLLQSDAEQAARGVVQALQDIENATQLRFDSGLGINPGADQEARARVLDDARRQTAPALFALSDSVKNAVLQGPSRQALNAADITTQQGTAELNRLLRGDDSARDQNLLELQKQTAELQKLNTNLENNGVAD